MQQNINAILGLASTNEAGMHTRLADDEDDRSSERALHICAPGCHEA